MIAYDTNLNRLDLPHQCLVATHSWIYGPNKSDEMPNPDIAKWVVENPLRNFHGPLLIDIEKFPVTDWDNHTKFETAKNHLAAAIQMYRAIRPGLRIGLYGLMPWSHYHSLELAEIKGMDVRANRRSRFGLGSLCSLVDFVTPVLYEPYGTNIDQTVAWIRYTLTAAGSFFKPILPIVWPFAEHKERRLLHLEFWKTMLREIASHPARVEGVICWDERPNPWPVDYVNAVRKG